MLKFGAPDNRLHSLGLHVKSDYIFVYSSQSIHVFLHACVTKYLHRNTSSHKHLLTVNSKSKFVLKIVTEIYKAKRNVS